MVNGIDYKFIVTALIVGGLIYSYGGSGPSVCSEQFREQAPSLNAWESSNYLVGPPTDLYFDNLRQDINYVTSWVNAGFTNQFINYVNLIYLGTISERIPIVPPFAPEDHISRSAGTVPFGSVFDLDALRHTLRTPILEWSSVKNPAHSSPETLGCWSTRSPHEEEPIKSETLLEHLKLDVSYTRVPAQLRRTTGHMEPHVLFFPTAELIFPGSPSHNASEYPLMYPSPHGSMLSPDLHLACFDLMYFATAGLEDYEWNYPWSPAWRVIGRHLKFTREIMDLAEGYLRRLFGISGDLPKFISIHIRRGDFFTQCNGMPVEQCLPPLSAYAQRVREVQDELFKARGWNVSRVVLSSDETSPGFWTSASAQGWYFINHTAERTLEQYGEWHVPIVDIAVQSLAVGFVGTLGSTVSLVSAKRVEEWNGGVTRNVKLNRA